MNEDFGKWYANAKRGMESPHASDDFVDRVIEGMKRDAKINYLDYHKDIVKFLDAEAKEIKSNNAKARKIYE